MEPNMHEWQVAVARAIKELAEIVEELNPEISPTFDLDTVLAPTRVTFPDHRRTIA